MNVIKNNGHKLKKNEHIYNYFSLVKGNNEQLIIIQN